MNSRLILWGFKLRRRGAIINALLCLGLAASASAAAPPDLAPTPPMGWNSCNHFGLHISDRLIRVQARAMASNGMKAAGYTYIVIDGGWEGYHDAEGLFHSDPNHFPDMKGLCDYIHSLGLKVGLHDCPGPKTCSRREASYGHERQDAETFADWGIDFIKYDWCTGDWVYQPNQMQAAYRKMAEDLRATGRPILYSLCQYGMQEVWKWGASVGGQMWRTTGDIHDNYTRMLSIGFSQNGLEKYAGPGHWNDPDMLEVGNDRMTEEEDRTHMSLWCLLAAPLFAGNDLTAMSPATFAILTNPEVIAVDQDRAGIQGHRLSQDGPLFPIDPGPLKDWAPATVSDERQLEIWVKPLADGRRAVGLFNATEAPATMTVRFDALGLSGRVKVRDLWERRDEGVFRGVFTATVPRHGVVLLTAKAASWRPQDSPAQAGAGAKQLQE